MLGWLAVGRVWSLWFGTPWLNSAQRHSQVHHVGRFLRACAPLGIPAGEESPFDSAMWMHPLRCRLRQRWSFSHIDFSAGGGRPRKRTVVSFNHCGTPPCRSLQCRSSHNMCTFKRLTHRHWRICKQNNQSLLAAKLPRRIAVLVADCLRRCVMNLTVSRL